MRSDSFPRCSAQVNQNHLWIGEVVSVFEQLFDQFRAAFSEAHRAKTSVTGMAVRAQNHFSAAAEHFPGILMNDGLMCRHKDTAVFFRGGKPEQVIVLIDRPADSTQTVVTVGERIGQWKFFHTAGSCSLYNADIGNVMGNHRVKAYAESPILRIAAVVPHNLISHCAVFRLFRLCSKGIEDPAPRIKHTMIDQFHLIHYLLSLIQ